VAKRTIKSVKNSCDRLWATLVRARAANTCERCGEPARESHHAYGRADHRLRFNVRNGVSMCFQCHVWAESYPIEFTNWFRGDRTEDAAYLSLEHQKGPIRRTLRDYLELENDLAEQLGALTEMAA
jgi:hypothetical protein